MPPTCIFSTEKPEAIQNICNRISFQKIASPAEGITLRFADDTLFFVNSNRRLQPQTNLGAPSEVCWARGSDQHL